MHYSLLITHCNSVKARSLYSGGGEAGARRRSKFTYIIYIHAKTVVVGPIHGSLARSRSGRARADLSS